jgi:hypothetical protein
MSKRDRVTKTFLGEAFSGDHLSQGGFAIVALRHQAWGAPSQSCGSVSLPRDAAVQ